ncbi:MAG: trigger factor [Planctomycetes bacterium]|nr:trigger factor [Planctomycetota bacterium]
MTIGQEELQAEDLEPIEVKTSVSETGKWAKRLGITVSSAEIGKAFDSAVGEIASQIRLPGFRPGKVPRGYAEKLFKDDIAKQVTSKIVSRAIRSAVSGEKLEVVGSPSLVEEKVAAERGKDLVFQIDVEIKPTFELCNYKGLPVEQEEVEVFPEEIQEQIDQMSIRLAEEEDAPEGSALQDKDIGAGVLRFVVDGQEIHKEEEAMLLLHQGHVVGAHAHLSIGFLEGAKPGEKRTIEETLNDSFPVESARGKKATLEFELKKIRRPKLPAIDDEFAKKVGAKDLADLKEKITERLRTGLAESIEAKTRKDMIERIIAGSPFDVPPRLKETFDQRMLMDQQMQLLRMGIPMEQLKDFDFGKHNEGNAERQIREYFILDAICKKEKIEVGDEDVDDEVVKLARARNMRAAELLQQLEQEGALEQIRQGLMAKKAMEFLTEQAEIKVVPRKPPQKGESCGHDHGASHGHEHDHSHGHAHGEGEHKH